MIIRSKGQPVAGGHNRVSAFQTSEVMHSWQNRKSLTRDTHTCRRCRLPLARCIVSVWSAQWNEQCTTHLQPPTFLMLLKQNLEAQINAGTQVRNGICIYSSACQPIVRIRRVDRLAMHHTESQASEVKWCPSPLTDVLGTSIMCMLKGPLCPCLWWLGVVAEIF